MKNIYVVLSHTGTILSRIIRRATGDKYTHASISLDENLDTKYSFGRIFPSNPVIGGFVKESPHYGTMKKFKMANTVVIRLKVEEEKYKEINDYINAMYARRKQYHYNYIGLFLARFGLHFHRDNYYYCSEFVKDLLARFNIVDEDAFSEAVRPIELLNLNGDVVYRGRLCEYSV